MPYLRQQPGRSYYRWYFYDPEQSLQTQTKGIAVKLKRLGWFGNEIGSAVVKDMSMGGAGLLAPLKDKVPDEFWVLYEIVSPPASQGLPKLTQRELLAAWIENAASPLAVATSTCILIF